MKRAISLLLSATILISAFSVVDLSSLAQGYNVSNRVQWLSTLVDVFDMKVDSNNYPDNYFSDISSDSKYYRDVMVATEFGLVDIEAGNPVNPEGQVTREFAAHTMNFCMGYKLDDDTDTKYTFADSSECVFADDDQIAVNRKWFNLDSTGRFNPDMTATQDELLLMIDDAKSTLNLEKVDENHDNKYVFADYVKVIPQNATYTIDEENTVRIVNCPIDISEGDTFVVYNNEIPVVRTVQSISASNNVTTITTAEASDDAIVSIDMENTASVDVANFKPSDEFKNEISTQKSRGVSASTQGIKIDKKITVNGVDINLKANITNIKINTKIDTSNGYCLAVVSYDADFNANVSAKSIDVELPLGTVPVLGIGDVTLYLDLNFKGNATVNQKIKVAAGFSFSKLDGLKNITSFQKDEFSLKLEVSGFAGLKLAASVNILVIKAQVYASAGFKGDVTNDYRSNTFPRMCTTIKAYLYFDLGYRFEVNFLITKYKKESSTSLLGINNSPIRVYFHLEDGVFTNSCTRGNEFKYLTDSNSSVAQVNPEYFYNLSQEKQFELTRQISESDLNYVISGNSVTITRYAGFEGKYKYIVIPSEIKGKKVTKIANNAFKNCEFTSIIIPKTIEQIGDYAFYGSTSLDKIVILSDNVTIGAHAFDWNLGNADQSVGNVPVYCNSNSTAYKFCQQNKGFNYRSLAWDGTTIWGVYSENKTYHISTPQELAYISVLLQNGYSLSGYTIKIEADIDLNNKNFSPIGSSDMPFMGSLDGNNNTIKNLKPIKSNSNNSGDKYHNSSGLFGLVKANGSTTFSNLKIARTITSGTGATYFGSLIGALLPYGNITVSNITTECDSTEYNASSYIGGIIGYIDSENSSKVTIEHCVNNGKVKSTTWDGACSGGIVGGANLNENAYLTFSKCASTNEIWSDERGAYSHSTSGGIIGKATGGNYIFSECAVSGSIWSRANGDITNEGVLVSDITPKSIKIENCELFSHVYGVDAVVGGFIGGLDTSNIDYTKSYIKNSYASEFLEGNSNVSGAFINCKGPQDNFNLPIINTYFDGDKVKPKWLVYGTTIGGLFWGDHEVPIGNWCVNSGVKTSDELKTDHSLYSQWNFENIWKYSDSGYPILRCFDNIEPCSEHKYYSQVTAPTCTGQGYTTHTCSNCSKWYKDTYVDALGHDYSIYSKTVEPTCTAKGYDLYKCTRCNSTEKRNYTDMIEHEYVLTGYQEPTCTQKGGDYYKCSVCSNVKIENQVAALGHDYVLEQTVEPTCTEGGYELYKCSVCGATEKRNAKDATGHNYTVISNTATCTDGGIKTSKCDNCGDIKVEDSSALGHKYNISYDSPSCIADGGYTYTCSVCGYVNRDVYKATGHDYGLLSGKEYIDFVENSSNKVLPESDNGLNEYYHTSVIRMVRMAVQNEIRVDRNNLVEIEDYQFSGKNRRIFDTSNVKMFVFDNDTDENCADFAIPYTDSDGNLLNPNYVDYLKNGQWHRGKYTLDKNNQVLNENETVVCAKPDNIRSHISFTKDEATDLNITDSNGKVSVRNLDSQYVDDVFYSAGIPGVYFENKEYTFSWNKRLWLNPYKVDTHCKEKPNSGEYTVLVGFSSGSYSGSISTKIKIYDKDKLVKREPATVTKDEKITYTCFDCGDIKTETTSLDIKNFKIKSVSLALESSITMNFKVSKSAVLDFENPYMEFTCGNKKETVTEYAEQGDYLVFSYKGISPQLMNDDVVAVLHAEHNGIDYKSPQKVMSIKTYAYAILDKYNSDSYAKLRTLMVDLLNYGAAAQAYIGYEENDLVNSALTQQQKQWAITNDRPYENIRDYSYKTISSPSCKWVSGSLVLGNSVTVRAKFSADNIENKTVVVTCGNAKFEYTKEDFISCGNGYYYVYCDEIYANEMSKELYFTVYENGIQCSNTMRYSIESYAKLVKDAYPNTAIEKMISAMMRYGDSAKAYGL